MSGFAVEQANPGCSPPLMLQRTVVANKSAHGPANPPSNGAPEVQTLARHPRGFRWQAGRAPEPNKGSAVRRSPFSSAWFGCLLWSQRQLPSARLICSRREPAAQIQSKTESLSRMHLRVLRQRGSGADHRGTAASTGGSLQLVHCIPSA